MPNNIGNRFSNANAVDQYCLMIHTVHEMYRVQCTIQFVDSMHVVAYKDFLGTLESCVSHMQYLSCMLEFNPLPIVFIADHSEPLQDPSTATPSSFQGSLSPASKMVATPLRFMQRMTGSSETERLREINSKMQRCLEEALMKNISLQEVCGVVIIIVSQHYQLSPLCVYPL